MAGLIVRLMRGLMVKLMVLALGVAAGLGTGSTVAAASPNTDVATEVCEDMVASAVEATIDRPLATPQSGIWVTPNKRYVCTYDVGGGELVLRVDVQRDVDAARDAYRRARARAGPGEKLSGIGQQAHQAADGTVLARKDQFLLRVDPLDLPEGLSKRDLALAAAVAVMTCW